MFLLMMEKRRIKKYVDTQLNDKANKNDLNSYLKLDGTNAR